MAAKGRDSTLSICRPYPGGDPGEWMTDAKQNARPWRRKLSAHESIGGLPRELLS